MLALVVLLLGRGAHADNVDALIAQLEDSSDKVRLSAALNLSKLGDPKAILGLVKRLGAAVETSKNVRSAAAVGLGTLVGDKVKGSQRELAIKALRDAQANDPSEFVKVQAERALEKIGAKGTSAPTTPGGAIYVNIGPMSAKTGTNDAKFRAMMVKVSTATLSAKAPAMQQTWPGGAPTKQQLAAKNFQGFYVDGTLNEIKVEKSGNTATISCKVSMLLASYPDKSVFGFLNGGAKVQGSSSQRDIDLGTEDCVSAVIEDLIAKKIVPTIKSKVGP
ncbi:MAG TPA: HEAT repeat domain-containing protein [Kofleriaceae bacterium]|nr:HEAT repeat domain-containing protein [Kofleriaceae bacterium]